MGFSAVKEPAYKASFVKEAIALGLGLPGQLPGPELREFQVWPQLGKKNVLGGKSGKKEEATQ